METRADDVEKEGALHALLITLADASATFKQMQRLKGHAGRHWPSTWHGRWPTCSASQAADKHGTCHGGRLPPHYTSPLSSSASLSNADLVSRPNKISARPYCCTCSCLAFAWLPPPRRGPVPRYLAPVRRGTCTTIIAVRCLRHAMLTTEGWGRAWGSPCGARVKSLEKTVHRPRSNSPRWWWMCGGMVGLDTGPPLGDVQYLLAYSIKESLCRRP